MRKTLLFDLTSLDTPSRRRGTGRYVHELALGLARLPQSALAGIRLLGLTHLDARGRFRVTEDVGSFAGSDEGALPSQADHYRWAYARRFALFRAVRAIGADAVHLGDPNATPLLMSRTRCLRIVTCHDTIPMHFPKRYFGKHDGGPVVGAAIERRRYASADLVVAISDATKRDVCALLGVPERRVTRVYNGVDVARWATPPSIDAGATLHRLGLANRRFVLYVGGLHWHKNVEGMMAGIARAALAGEELHLVWAGHLTPEQAVLVRGEAAHAGVERVFHEVGFVTDEELGVLYRAAVAHLLVSRVEGFGLTVVEAMAAGCPVVTTASGSLAEVAGDAAVTVNPEDHRAIGDALVRVARDASLRAALVDRGRAQAARFTLDAQARAMADVYRHFLDT
jgi:glycosyltransferase involved in cell wall biosynthesis